jgi:hypothetical protein
MAKRHITPDRQSEKQFPRLLRQVLKAPSGALFFISSSLKSGHCPDFAVKSIVFESGLL